MNRPGPGTRQRTSIGPQVVDRQLIVDIFAASKVLLFIFIADYKDRTLALRDDGLDFGLLLVLLRLLGLLVVLLAVVSLTHGNCSFAKMANKRDGFFYGWL
jgi:hypothetical protein